MTINEPQSLSTIIKPPQSPIGGAAGKAHDFTSYVAEPIRYINPTQLATPEGQQLAAAQDERVRRAEERAKACRESSFNMSVAFYQAGKQWKVFHENQDWLYLGYESLEAFCDGKVYIPDPEFPDDHFKGEWVDNSKIDYSAVRVAINMATVAEYFELSDEQVTRVTWGKWQTLLSTFSKLIKDVEKIADSSPGDRAVLAVYDTAYQKAKTEVTDWLDKAETFTRTELKQELVGEGKVKWDSRKFTVAKDFFGEGLCQKLGIPPETSGYVSFIVPQFESLEPGNPEGNDD